MDWLRRFVPSLFPPELPPAQCGVEIHMDGMLVDMSTAGQSFEQSLATAIHLQWIYSLQMPEVEFLVFCLEWTV